MSSKSHEAWKEQLPAYLLGALNPGDKTDIEHHLGGCSECQAELRWLEPAIERLVEGVDQVEPSPALKSRLMAAVEADLKANDSPETLAAPVETTRTETKPRDKREKRARFNFGQLMRPAALGAMTAVLFVGVIVGYAVNGGDSNSPGTGRNPVVTQTIPSDSNVGDADAVMVTTGNSGTLKVTNLPKLDDGDVYQAWIQKGQSVEPTDSLFTPRKDGTATTSIPDLTGVDTVMVSAEPKGGSKQPTTAPIITIDIPS